MRIDPPAAWRSAHWRAFAVLVLLALSVILLRPMCDVLESHLTGSASNIEHISTGHHESDATPCCASIEDASLVASAGSATEEKRSPGLAIDPGMAVRATIPLTLQVDVARPQPPLQNLPYHARTARILV